MQNTILSIESSTIHSKIEEEQMLFTQQIYESLQKLRNDPKEINVLCRIATWRGSITLINIRPNSEMLLATIFQSENMELSDLLSIYFLRSKLILFIDFPKMEYFICFSLKQNGDPLEKTTTKQTESMLTIGKILEESHLILIIVKVNEITGDLQDT